MASDTIQAVGTVAKTVSATLTRTSLTRLSKDSIFQFPFLISSGIGTDLAMLIAKTVEKQYAAFMVSAISMNNTMDISKFKTTADYLKQFHSNSDIPTNIAAATNTVLESAEFIDIGDPRLARLALECWDRVEDRLEMSSLNNTYLPNIRTHAMARNQIAKAKAGLENAAQSFSDKIKDVAKEMERDDERTMDGSGPHAPTKGAAGSSYQAAVVKNDKLSSMEPTLINIQIVAHGGAKKGNPSLQWTQNLVVGIKTMVRVVRSESMIANMVEASKDSNTIFKFIQWTKGELKFKDLIFGIKDAKDLANASGSTRWFKALKRRKAINNFGRFVNNKVLPSTTIVMTSHEAAKVFQDTGIDLSERSQALQLIANYYLLGFIIVDTDTESLISMFDGDDDFAYTTMSALKATDAKNVDVMNSKDVMRLMGRI